MGLDKPLGLQVWTYRFQNNLHVKLARLSALATYRLFHQQEIPWYLFCYRLSRTDGHTTAGSFEVN
jgi:hypothetical protein